MALATLVTLWCFGYCNAQQTGDFFLYRPKQIAIPSDSPRSFDSFPLAMENEHINEEIDWNSYNWHGTVDNIVFIGGGLLMTTPWQNPPFKPSATFLRIPEIPWLTGKEQVLEVPIETDGQIATTPSSPNSPMRQEIRQEWVTDVTKLQVGGEEYDVYANVTPSQNSFSYISVDADRRVYISYPDSITGQTRYYYRIDTEGLGKLLYLADMPPVVTHRIPAIVTETRQRVISTKLFLHLSAHSGQTLRRHTVSLYKYPVQYNQTAETSEVYQMGEVTPHDTAVDQVGDVLPSTGEIVTWNSSMAGKYIGTLVAGEDEIRAPIGYGTLQSLTISKNGAYSGVIRVRDNPALPIHGRISPTASTSVFAEVRRGKAAKRGCRLAFMKMADGKISLVARCYMQDGNQYYCLAEKIALPQSMLPSRHTLVMPVEDQDATSANATGQMRISNKAYAYLFWRFPNGKTFTQTTRISEKGMIPIFIQARNDSIVGRLRYMPGRQLGDWTGAMEYRVSKGENDFYHYNGVITGHPFHGWSSAPIPVTIHIEYPNQQVTQIPATFSKNTVTGGGVTLGLAADGAIRGTLKLPEGKPIQLNGVALASQHIWTCTSNSADIKKITVTGVWQE